MLRQPVKGHPQASQYYDQLIPENEKGGNNNYNMYDNFKLSPFKRVKFDEAKAN